MDAVPSGSCLAVVHAASDACVEDMSEAERRYNAEVSARFHARDHDQVSRFFDGLDLVGPGLVNLNRWWSAGTGHQDAEQDVAAYCGLARKP
jgi:hypothetical protein